MTIFGSNPGIVCNYSMSHLAIGIAYVGKVPQVSARKYQVYIPVGNDQLY